MVFNLLHFRLLFLVLFLHQMAHLAAPLATANISRIYLFLKEEEVPVGKVILSASHAVHLAREYSKRGIYSVMIEEPNEPSPELFFPETLFYLSGRNDYFSINEHTGLVKTTRRLDFDTPGLQAAGCIPNEATSEIKVLSPNNPFSIKTTSYCCFPLRIICRGEDTLQLDICIEDVNDNTPRWNLESTGRTSYEHKSSVLKLTVPENLPLGNVLEIPAATDADSGQNKAITYEMWPGLAEFELVSNATTGKLYLRLTKELDRELESTYKSNLIARDGGVEPNTGSLSLLITVQDANDNDPVFEKSTYYVTIPENTQISSHIAQVNAVDPDLGTNADVVYSISTLTDPEFDQMFSVDPHTGWIKLEREVDFENHRQISLTITASDRGEPPRQSTCLMEITLTDVNDNAPKLLFEPGNLTNFALVPENEIAGRIVAVFTVVDEDSGANGETMCWIKSVSQGEGKKEAEESEEREVDKFFKLELMALPFAKVYQLSTAAVFDREAVSKYRVGIICADRGSPSQNTTGYVLVRVQDENDHPPEFPAKHFTFRASENHQVGTALFTLVAEDGDEGENATVVYSLTSSDALFTINNETGEVSLQQTLDYEKQTQHNFTILAVDGGQPARTGSAAVTLFVDDANDNAPLVTSDLLLSVFENHSAVLSDRVLPPSADPVGAFTAMDLDSGLNGIFYFKIASIKPCFCGISPAGEKTVNFNESLCSWALEMVNKCDVNLVAKNHRLCSRVPPKYAPSWTSKEYRRFLMTERGDVYLRYPNLDRETVPVYLIQGVVTDRGHPPQATVFCATVVINDVNDCHPRFTFPALTNNTVLVRLPIQRGEPLVQLHATDADAYENGELRFALAEESDASVASLFSIHPFSGLMVSKYSLQPEDLEFLGPTSAVMKQIHTVQIMVTDLGTPSLVSYASLLVRFQMRPNPTGGLDFPSLQEQLMQQQQHHKQNQNHQSPDLLNELSTTQAEKKKSFDRSAWRSSTVFIILCALFLILLLFLTILLLAIFTRRSLRPLPTCPPTTTAAAVATSTSRRAPMPLFVSPTHYHQNHNYRRNGSSLTLPLPATPCHTLSHSLPRTCGLSGSGDLSIDSSAV